MNQLKPNFLFSLHRHSTLRVSCGLGKCSSVGGGGARRFPGRSVSCQFSVLGAEKQGPLSLSAGSPATLVYQGAEAHCPLNRKLPFLYRKCPPRSPTCRWSSFMDICCSRVGPVPGPPWGGKLLPRPSPHTLCVQGQGQMCPCRIGGERCLHSTSDLTRLPPVPVRA